MKHQYDCLVNGIKYLCPGTRVVISKVPPRKASVETMRTIVNLNSQLESLSDPNIDVQCVDVCPKITRYYKSDKVHFNDSGVRFYAKKMSCELKNVQSVPRKPCR